MKKTYSEKRTMQPLGFTVDRLNSELAALRRTADNAAKGEADALIAAATLRAENEKLRAALTDIAIDKPDDDKYALMAIARAALKEAK